MALWMTNRERHWRFVESQLLPAWGLTHAATWLWLKVTDDGRPVSQLVRLSPDAPCPSWTQSTAHLTAGRALLGRVVGRLALRYFSDLTAFSALLHSQQSATQYAHACHWRDLPDRAIGSLTSSSSSTLHYESHDPTLLRLTGQRAQAAVRGAPTGALGASSRGDRMAGAPGPGRGRGRPRRALPQAAPGTAPVGSGAAWCASPGGVLPRHVAGKTCPDLATLPRQHTLRRVPNGLPCGNTGRRVLSATRLCAVMRPSCSNVPCQWAGAIVAAKHVCDKLIR